MRAEYTNGIGIIPYQNEAFERVTRLFASAEIYRGHALNPQLSPDASFAEQAEFYSLLAALEAGGKIVPAIAEFKSLQPQDIRNYYENLRLTQYLNGSYPLVAAAMGTVIEPETQGLKPVAVEDSNSQKENNTDHMQKNAKQCFSW